MPVRDVSNFAGNITGAIPSRKLGRMVHFESLIERAYIFLLEHDLRVRSYEEQPCIIHYEFEGRARHYTPDFKVEWSHRRSSIVECKPDSKLDDQANRLKWTAAQLWCERRGYTFAVVTKTLVDQHAILLDNLSNLSSHAYARFAPQTLDYVLANVLATKDIQTVDILANQLTRLRPQVARACIWHLLAIGLLSADLTRPLHLKRTVITVAGGPHA